MFEGANMPCDRGAVLAFHAARVVYVPGKAAKAGGVAVSGLEMAQNSQRERWTREAVDKRLRAIMARIYAQMCASRGEGGTLEQGANRAGFVIVADAMRALGWV